MNCRFCNQPLTHVFIDLGKTPLSNSFLEKINLKDHEASYPLKIFVCSSCYLVQVDEYRKAEDIFSDEYIYFSSYSTSWLAHAKKYTDMMQKRFGFNQHSLIAEIASNDGYLLQYFKEKNIPVLGIEPTLGTANVARSKGIETITEFFGTKLATKLSSENRQADLLLGNNVLAHVPDINDFVSGLKIALKDHGVITMEFPSLLQLVEENQYDTIYHEHFSYLSFSTVQQIFLAHELELFDVEELTTHGGSLRIYAKHQGDTTFPLEKRVTDLLTKEEKAGIKTPQYYDGFQKRAEESKNDFISFLQKAKNEGKKVCGYGAAAKGNTLLNYCGITTDLISFVADVSPHKQGKFLPGSHIPVVHEMEIKKLRPDFIVILPWNIKNEIMQQLQYVREWDCKFVTAIPNLQIF